MSYLGSKTVSYFSISTLLAKPELLPYPFSSTRTSLHPLRSIRNLNGNPDKNASNAENLGYFRNLRVSETSVGAIILDSRILTTIRMRSLLQKALWSGKHEIAWRRQKAETDKFKIHPFTINSKMREVRRETLLKSSDFLPLVLRQHRLGDEWTMRMSLEPLSSCPSHISRARIMERNAGDLSNVLMF